MEYVLNQDPIVVESFLIDAAGEIDNQIHLGNGTYDPKKGLEGVFKVGRILQELKLPPDPNDPKNYNGNPLYDKPDIFRTPVEIYTEKQWGVDIKDFTGLVGIIDSVSNDLFRIKDLCPEKKEKLKRFLCNLSRKIAHKDLMENGI